MLIATHAAIPAVLLLTAAGAGTLVLRHEPLALRMTLGLAMWAHALFLLGLVGQLRVGPIVLLVLVSVAGLRGHGVRALSQPRDLVTPQRLAAAVFFAPIFLLALHPPVAFDETLYHLPFVHELAESGALRFHDHMRFPVFPQFQELLSVPLFLLGGDTATHLLSLAEVLLAAALLFEWGNRHAPRAGWLAAAFFLGGPIVVHLATIGYVDAALALFVTAGFSCLDRGRHALAGFFLGTACGVKYLGGFFAAAAVRRRTILTIAAAALPTTLWLVITTGNPVFPFVFSNPWSLPMADVPAATRVTRTLGLVWNVTFAREHVNAQPPFTPFFAVAIAVTLFAAVRDRRARFVAVLAAAYVVVFSFLPQDSRYLVPLLPLLGGVSAVWLARRWPKALPWLAILAIAPGIAYAAYRLNRNGLPPATAEQRRALLARHIPEYDALRRADGTVYVCGAEQSKYHAPVRLLGDHNGPYAFERVLTGDVAANLRRIGARYLLVSTRLCTISPAGLELVFEDEHAQLWRVQSSPSRR